MAIATREIQSHTFHLPDDSDWVRFDAHTGAIYTINTLNLSPDCDTVLDLFDSEGRYRRPDEGRAHRKHLTDNSKGPLIGR